MITVIRLGGDWKSEETYQFFCLFEIGVLEKLDRCNPGCQCHYNGIAFDEHKGVAARGIAEHFRGK